MKKTLLIICVCVCAWAANAAIIDLGTLTYSGSTYGQKVINDGDVLTGTLDGATTPYQLIIAANAHITLNGVTILGKNGASVSSYPFGGLTCNGSVEITLVGTNYVRGFSLDYPGIYIPAGKTLTIKKAATGNGTLTVAGGRLDSSTADGSGGSSAAGIGGGWTKNCGNIEIESGKIIAYGGSSSAAIGGGYNASCGQIIISGGEVEAYAAQAGPGIGAGQNGSVGLIALSGGCTVHAEGHDYGDGIGGAQNSTTGNITIMSDVARVTAVKGGSGCHIGVSTGSQINIGGYVQQSTCVSDGDAFRYPACSAPTITNAVNITKNSAAINWTRGSSLQTKFDVAYKKDSDHGTSHKIVTNATTASLTGLTPGSTYHVQIKGYCSEAEGDESEYSAMYDFTTLDECVAPTNVTTSNIGTNEVTIDWTAASGQQAWYIQYSYGYAMPQTVYVYEHPYRLTGLEANKTYTIQVQASCGTNNRSDWSTAVSFTTLDNPTPSECATPKYVNIEDITANSAKVTWTPGGSESGWEIRYKAKNDAYLIKAGSASQPSFVLTELDPMTEYEVYVRAICGISSESEDAVRSFITSPEIVEECNAPTEMMTQILTDTKALVAWIPAGTETKWNFIYKRTADANYMYVTVQGDPYYELKDLEPNTSYSANVYAICSADSWSAWYNDGIDFTFTTRKAEGIDNLQDQKAATKIIRDGQLLILVGDKTYDAQGNELR